MVLDRLLNMQTVITVQLIHFLDYSLFTDHVAVSGEGSVVNSSPGQTSPPLFYQSQLELRSRPGVS